MKIFGNPMSTCTRKVMMTAHETQTPFEVQVVDMGKGEHKQAANLARQPFGQVPSLEDGGFCLYEARAMARYIDQKAGSPLTPKDIQGRALMEQWISVETENFRPHAMKFIYHAVFKREQPEAVLAAASQALDVTYRVLDQRLSTAPFLAGAELTLADIVFMPYLQYLTMTPAAGQLNEFPHAARWWTKVSERPTWQKTIGR